MFALTGVAPLPVTVAGTPGTVVPYEVVSPYSNVTVVEAPPASTVPLSVAVVEPTEVAGVVTAAGSAGSVVKVISWPFEVPLELAPLTL